MEVGEKEMEKKGVKERVDEEVLKKKWMRVEMEIDGES